MNGGLDAAFKEAQSNVTKLSEDPGNEAKLKLYALFKQVSRKITSVAIHVERVNVLVL